MKNLFNSATEFCLENGCSFESIGMWKRSSWHDCAAELASVSERFCRAHWGKDHGRIGGRTPEDNKKMEEESIQGVAILRALALAVRSEQDFGLLPKEKAVIGFERKGIVVDADIINIKRGRGFVGLRENSMFKPISLRESLNKIAHGNPSKADYYVGAGNRQHDLILAGRMNTEDWLALVSLDALIDAIKMLPEHDIVRA